MNKTQSEQIFEDPHGLIFIQTRAAINPALVAEYAAMMQDGVQFDAAQAVRDDDGQVYVWDGGHRGQAAKQAGALLLLDVQPGDRQAAEWLALSANQKHGQRRTHEDIQHIIHQALRHPNGVNLSDRELARHCGVDHKTVGKIRVELELSGDIPQIDTRQVSRAGQTYVQNTRNIGENQIVKPRIETSADGRPYGHQPEAPQPEFECPRCGERAVKLNGQALCLNPACGTSWSREDFLAEAGLEHTVELKAAANPITEQQSSPIPIKYIVKTRVNSLIERLSAEKLTQLDNLLADFDSAYLSEF